MKEFPAGVWIEINSRCYSDYEFAEVVYHRTGGGYVVNLYKDGKKTHRTIVFDSEVIGMAAMTTTDDGQSPSDILEEIRRRRQANKDSGGTAGNTSTATNHPMNIDPKILRDAMDMLKKKVKSGQSPADLLEDDCITPEMDDAAERYDRAMKGIL